MQVTVLLLSALTGFVTKKLTPPTLHSWPGQVRYGGDECLAIGVDCREQEEEQATSFTWPGAWAKDWIAQTEANSLHLLGPGHHICKCIEDGTTT